MFRNYIRYMSKIYGGKSGILQILVAVSMVAVFFVTFVLATLAIKHSLWILILVVLWLLLVVAPYLEYGSSLLKRLQEE